MLTCMCNKPNTQTNLEREKDKAREKLKGKRHCDIVVVHHPIAAHHTHYRSRCSHCQSRHPWLL